MITYHCVKCDRCWDVETENTKELTYMDGICGNCSTELVITFPNKLDKGDNNGNKK